MSIAQYIDHTNLKATATQQDIANLCEEAIEHRFRAVCVNSQWVDLARACLFGTDIKIAAVIGFPLGANHLAVKVYESQIAANCGARELDVVWNIGKFKEEKYLQVMKELQEIVDTVHAIGVLVKVIVETCYLSYDEIVQAHQIVKDSGAFCIKTSTGAGLEGAEYPTVLTWRELGGLQIKASGGIHTLAQVSNFIEVGADIIGTSHGVSILQEPEDEVKSKGPGQGDLVHFDFICGVKPLELKDEA